MLLLFRRSGVFTEKLKDRRTLSTQQYRPSSGDRARNWSHRPPCDERVGDNDPGRQIADAFVLTAHIHPNHYFENCRMNKKKSKDVHGIKTEDRRRSRHRISPSSAGSVLFIAAALQQARKASTSILLRSSVLVRDLCLVFTCFWRLGWMDPDGR